MKNLSIALFILIFSAASSVSFENDNVSSEIKLKLKEKPEISLKQVTREQPDLISGFSISKIDKQGKAFVLKEQNDPKSKINYFDAIAGSKKKYKVDAVKMAILGAVGAGVFTGMHIYYSNTWWKDQVTYFKYAEDGYYARNIDKASHVFTANFFTVASATAYEWAGVNPNKALLYGAFTSIAYETYIEINDGFAPIWGFDWGDMGANIAGALYPFLQKLYSPLEHINFKWSFRPEWIKKKATEDADLLDDYTNMTFWLSVNPMIVLPETVTKAKFYPNFLALALGMSIKNASHTKGNQNAEVEWFLSLDWDVTKLPGKSDFMQKLKKILNFYHFPAPAVRVSPSGIWYGLYF